MRPLLVILLSSLAACLPVEDDDITFKTEVFVSEVEVEVPGHRSKREPGMPGRKKFHFHLNNHTVELDLELNNLIRNDIPMYVTENGTTRLVESNENNKEQYGYYQERKTKASVMVKCNKMQCKPLGTFWLNGRKYRLDPNGDLAESTHFVSELSPRPEDVNIKGDVKTKFEFINPADGSPLVNGTKIELPSTPIKKNGHERARRTIPAGVDIIELFFYTDDAIYARFRSLYNDSTTTLAMIRQYYSLIGNEMDLEYQQVKYKNNAGIDIRIYVKGIHIAMDLAAAQWSALRFGRLDASRALEAFSVMQKNFQTSNNLQYDHAMAISGKPFRGDVVGIAWLNTVCSSDTTVHASLIEDRNLYLAIVAVHELGHCLSADHDSSSGVCSGGYIMGPSIYVANEAQARLQHEFSSCSITSFVNKLQSLGSNRCTLNHSFTDAEYTAYRSEPIGGEELSLDEQCQVYFGAASFACNKGNDMCYRGIYCQTSTGCNGRLYLVLNHSPCQQPLNKWCFRGLCVDASSSTTTTTDGSTTTTDGSTTTTDGSTTTTDGSTTTTDGSTTTTDGSTTTTDGSATTTDGSTTTTVAPTTTTSATTTICTITVRCIYFGSRFIGQGCCTNVIHTNCCIPTLRRPTCTAQRNC